MRLLLAAARSPSGPGKTTYIDCINRDRSYWIVPRVETRGNMSIASAEMQDWLEAARGASKRKLFSKPAMLDLRGSRSFPDSDDRGAIRGR